MIADAHAGLGELLERGGLTVQGDGHGILTQLGACALGAVVPYLNHGELPPSGATCGQDMPFTDSAVE